MAEEEQRQTPAQEGREETQNNDRNGGRQGDRRDGQNGRGGNREGGRRRKNDNNRRDDGYIERVVAINRVAKTVKGGRRMTFTALVVVGDGNGTVGVGYGKAKEVPAAIAKGNEEARKSFFHVPRLGTSIPHLVQGEDAAGVVLLRPASQGTGVIAGGAVRAIMEAAGVKDVLTKSLGSSNSINLVHATVDALKKLEQPEAVAARRGLPLEHVAPEAMLRKRAEAEQKQREDEAAEAAKVENEAAAAGVGA